MLASSPPAPPRISTITSLSSLGSRSTIARRISSSMRSIRALRALELGAHLGVLAALVEHLLRALGVGDGEAPLLGQLGGGGQLVEGAAGVGVALPVRDHLGIRHLRLRLGEARLDLVDQGLDHRVPDSRRLPRQRLRLRCGPRRRPRAGPRSRARPRARRSRPRPASSSGSRVVSFCSCMPGQMISWTQPLPRLRPANLISSKERPATSGTPTIRVASRMYQAGRPTGAKTKMATIITTSRKLVPQRGCRREKRWALAGVSGRPAS